MAMLEKSTRTAERVAETTRDSYELVVDHVVGLQERNVRFAQGVVDGAVKELRHQAEANREMTRELVERAEGQRDAVRTLWGETVDAYMDLAYAPYSYYKEGLRLVETEVHAAEVGISEVTTGFAIAGYDELNVEEIRGRLDGLTAAQVRELREYEKRNKNRETLIDQFDRKLKAASA